MYIKNNINNYLKKYTMFKKIIIKIEIFISFIITPYKTVMKKNIEKLLFNLIDKY